MGSSNESEIRLAELIWRTVKLRVSLLVLTIVVLLVVWSSLSNGNQEAQKIDTTFCEYLVDHENTVRKMAQEQASKSLGELLKKNGIKSGMPGTPPLVFSSEDMCHVGSSRDWIEITRHTAEELPWESTSTVDFVTKAANERTKAFHDYDTRRREAYRLEIHLSSEHSSSTIIINALTVAKIIPFCVFVVLTIVVVLGFQQSAYRRHLRALLRDKAEDHLSQAMAEAQFFAAPFHQVTSHPEKYLELSPVALATGTLSIVVVLLLFGMISTFILTLLHLTDSIISSYPFALYVSLFLLTWVLGITRRSYLENNRPASEQRDEDAWKPLSKGSRWLTICFASMAVLSLAFPWTTASPDDDIPFRGFQFLLKQRPTGELFTYTTYALSPPIFRDVRIQVTIAGTFILICALDALFRSHRAKPALAFLHEVRRFLAVCIFGLSIYFLLYLGALQYESAYWVPWLDKLTHLGSTNAKGYPMIYYNPAYGFWIFLACCLFLVLLSLATGTNRLGSWVPRVARICAPTWRSLVGIYRGKT
jgi:hypothetical protein